MSNLVSGNKTRYFCIFFFFLSGYLQLCLRRPNDRVFLPRPEQEVLFGSFPSRGQLFFVPK